jgi:transposase
MRTTPRLRRPQRHQASFDPRSLDQLLPPDHQARVVWQYVEGLDLAEFLARIKAVPGRPGQPATDPRLLLALWLQATIDGVGSARLLDKLCTEHLAYRWLCGEVSLNYHTLADFRSDNGELLDKLLTQSVATLVHQELVTLEEVAQDGMRVRANAGAHSFRREATLNELLRKAEERVEALKKQEGEDDGAADRRRKAAQKRAAEDRLERVKRALEERAKLAERQEELVERNGPKAKANAREPRASTTDPEARRMMMPDGGVRPGLNAEFATDTGSGIVVGVDVINAGSDGGQLKPMVEQIRKRYAKVPKRMLADGNFAKLEDIQALHEQEVVVYAPVKNAAKELDAGNNPFAAKPRDAEGVGLWRERMGTEAAKEIYKRRASTAEWANARARSMGLRQFAVRGVAKAKGQAVLVALAHNLRQMKQVAERSKG